MYICSLSGGAGPPYPISPKSVSPSTQFEGIEFSLNSAFLGFERVGSSFALGLGGISLIVSTIFLVSCILIQIKSSNNKFRNGLLFLISFLIISSGLLILNSESKFLPGSSHRYLNALNPFLTTTDPLVDSVSEHATTTLAQSFLFHSVLMIFSGIGIWLIIKNIQNKNSNFMKNDMTTSR